MTHCFFSKVYIFTHFYRLISGDASNPTVEVFLCSSVGFVATSAVWPVGFVASSPTVANYRYPTQPNLTYPFGNLSVDVTNPTVEVFLGSPVGFVASTDIKLHFYNTNLLPWGLIILVFAI